MKKAILPLCILILSLSPSGSGAFEIRKSSLFVYLHEVKPVEEKAAKALQEEDYAAALRGYREALKGYERIWKDYPDLGNERPRGIDRMVDESIETCKKIIEEIKDRGEAQDKFYRKLSVPLRVNFSNQHIRRVAKSLTFLADVDIIVDETVFDDSNDALNFNVNIRAGTPLSLRAIITRMCRQAGLAYSVESDHVFISTRVKLDDRK